ncbi:ABC transporter permease [Secundilactobacillus folii]|uniref:ABC transporter permease n=1 Tax=Secundilactobacillus folii TaxID=2678357 RepID=A0A7X3C378_9LACO|nr:ABC transporter permease [Secundilactobacillus folii]MTV82617.1 ABC transporter permease [Secundilactobacillus folii]
MNNLYRQRLSSHLKEMFKYLRLVFNDHFVFALLIFIGGLGLAYSNGLKELQAGLWWAKPVIFIVLLVVLQLGRFATLLQDADVVFLLPREADMRRYLTGARWYSESLGMLYQLFFMFILLPFIQVTDGMPVLSLALIALTQLLLKDAAFSVTILRRFQLRSRWLNESFWLNWLVPLVVLVCSIYILPVAGLVLALALMIGLRVVDARVNQIPFDWWKAIALENNRMLGVYRFFNLFTTVPMLKGVAKRRRYLDWLLNMVKAVPHNTYLYLYSRGIVRSGEFSGLYLRLTILGMILLYFVHGTWLPVLLAALFLYLIGFQLIPFYWQFDDIVFTHLYPIAESERVRSFKRLMYSLLTLTAVLFVIMIVIANLNWQLSLTLLVVEAVEVFLMVQYYLPLRLRRKA